MSGPSVSIPSISCGIRDHYLGQVVELVTMGSVNRAMIKPMELFSTPLQKRAVKLIVVHKSSRWVVAAITGRQIDGRGAEQTGQGVESAGDRSCDHYGRRILQFCGAGSDDRAAAKRDHAYDNGNEYNELPEDKTQKDGA
jgi:hypothetical protein